MPILHFKQQFVAAVKAGLLIGAAGRDPLPGEDAKLQTIRKCGKRRYKVGDTLFMYMGPRMAPTKLGEAICTSAHFIRIDTVKRSVTFGRDCMYLPLFDDEVEALARADGFASAKELFAFFAQESGGKAFFGQLIKW